MNIVSFGGLEQVLNASVDDFVHSILFTVLHAIVNAYTVKKSSPVDCNFFRLATSTIILAMGGGILTNFLLGNPQTVFFSSTIVPVYSTAAWIMSGQNSVIFKEIDNLPPAAKTLLFLLIDALSRGFTLPKFLVNLRSMDCSLTGQLILGIAAISGGGLMYNWFILKNSWKIGGYPFNVICIVVVANIFFMEIMESDKTSILFDLKLMLETNKLILSGTETKIVTSYAIYLGFLSQPNLLFPKTSAKTPTTDKVKQETPKTPKSAAKKPVESKSSSIKKSTKFAAEDSDGSDEPATETRARRRSTRLKKD